MAIGLEGAGADACNRGDAGRGMDVGDSRGLCRGVVPAGGVAKETRRALGADGPTRGGLVVEVLAFGPSKLVEMCVSSYKMGSGDSAAPRSREETFELDGEPSGRTGTLCAKRWGTL